MYGIGASNAALLPNARKRTLAHANTCIPGKPARYRFPAAIMRLPKLDRTAPADTPAFPVSWQVDRRS